MNPYWVAANMVLGLHMALLAGLMVGLVAAVVGVLRRYRRLALAFWATLLVAAIWQPLPSCILTDIERWLRHQVEPDWDRTISAQRILVGEVFRLDVSEQTFWWLGVVMVVVAGYVLWRDYRHLVRGTAQRLLM
ncbi:MAG: hypothetical protein HYX93_04210 [Chloroflexi bacterium]|nr:hypothetical protein [Chloroflexota bacterium]